ncbi:MAG: hypothetical protein NT161_02710 [Candidatus Nomurabacteria bacterium]|nr:hypothetical protein [Candidatus Nomurabacteria bacterium]
MNKINNKLILIFTILAFVFGLSSTSPVYAQNTGVIPFPYYYNNSGSGNRGDYPTPVYYSVPTPVNYNNQRVIAGCEGRSTGYSTTTGQSCVGNYVNNTNTNNNSSSTSSNTTTKNSDTSNTSNTTVSKTTDTNNTVAASDNNNSFSGLTANALEGSNSFLPTGLLQWIFLAIIVVAIIFLWRYVFRSEDKYLSEPLKHA